MADEMPRVQVIAEQHLEGYRWYVAPADLAAFVDAHLATRNGGSAPLPAASPPQVQARGAAKPANQPPSGLGMDAWPPEVLADSCRRWALYMSTGHTQDLLCHAAAALDALLKRCAELEAEYPDKMTDAHGRGQEDGWRYAIRAAARVIDLLHHRQLMQADRGLADKQRDIIASKIRTLTPTTTEFATEDPQDRAPAGPEAPELVAITHASDCAVHNGPAYDAGPCDCGAAEADAQPLDTVRQGIADRLNSATRTSTPRQGEPT